MPRPAYRPSQVTDLGTEIQCAECKEFCPADKEFFYMTNGKPHSWCKACYLADPKVALKRKRASDRKSALRTSQQQVSGI